ncbi:MAG: hypothetical protein ABJZ69_17630 [Hyphomicrobiales bacterium]
MDWAVQYHAITLEPVQDGLLGRCGVQVDGWLGQSLKKRLIATGCARCWALTTRTAPGLASSRCTDDNDGDDDAV